MTTTEHPLRERTLVVPLSDVEWRDSGDPERKDETTLRGHAAVFNSLSDDLGGFREIIEPGFFRAALRKKPDVRLLVNHDGLPLARTASGTLELREDTRGLHVFARLDKTDPDVASLRGKMQRGDVDQMSFAFTLREDGDDWAVADDGTVIRTMRADGADELFDVSVVTFPAYRQTDVSMRSVLQDAISRGRVPITVGQAIDLTSDEDGEAVAQGGPVAGQTYIVGKAGPELFVPVVPGTMVRKDGGAVVSDTVNALHLLPSVEGSTEVARKFDQIHEMMVEAEGEERDAAPDEVDVTQDNELLPEFQKLTRERRNEVRESYLRLLKEHGLK